MIELTFIVQSTVSLNMKVFSVSWELFPRRRREVEYLRNYSDSVIGTRFINNWNIRFNRINSTEYLKLVCLLNSKMELIQ